jgi:hypothetical protein
MPQRAAALVVVQLNPRVAEQQTGLFSTPLMHCFRKRDLIRYAIQQGQHLYWLKQL